MKHLGLHLLCVGLLVAGTHCARARVLSLGVSQEVGYEEDIRVENQLVDDGYSDTSLRVAMDHPMVFRGGRLTLDPTATVSYLKYFEADSLDTVTFDIRGPLRLALGGDSGRKAHLKIDSRLRRDVTEVSTGADGYTARTNLDLDALYRRALRKSRWITEVGYRYGQIFYDESEFQDQDRNEHELSAALFYGVRRGVEVGLRGSWTLETFAENTRDDASTLEVTTEARWQVTGRIEAAGELGYETVSQDGVETDETGMTVRGALDWQPTARWQCLADLRREFDVGTRAGDTQVQTSEASLDVAYQVTPKFTVSAVPGISREEGDDTVTESTLDLLGRYAFPAFDLTLQAGITDRQSDLGGNDEYTALDGLVRIDIDF